MLQKATREGWSAAQRRIKGIKRYSSLLVVDACERKRVSSLEMGYWAIALWCMAAPAKLLPPALPPPPLPAPQLLELGVEFAPGAQYVSVDVA